MAAHMLGHILIMSVIAPVGILAWRVLFPAAIPDATGRWIGAATAVQIVALWGWHLPPAVELAARSPTVSAAMSVSLLCAALWFWQGIIGAAVHARWRALGALLVTGKLFCLLGIVLTFAPRPLYGTATFVHMHGGGPLADQQLGGLFMLVACPLTYVLAAVVVSARWLTELDRSARWPRNEGAA